jgi:hypothetical protein
MRLLIVGESERRAFVSNPTEDEKLSEGGKAVFRAVTDLLADMLLRNEDSIKQIEAIVAEHIETLEEGSPERESWISFGGKMLLTDTFRNWTEINAHIAALRGMLVYRGLDPGARRIPTDQQG